MVESAAAMAEPAAEAVKAEPAATTASTSDALRKPKQS
jgi:hypothetical protein